MFPDPHSIPAPRDTYVVFSPGSRIPNRIPPDALATSPIKPVFTQLVADTLGDTGTPKDGFDDQHAAITGEVPPAGAVAASLDKFIAPATDAAVSILFGYQEDIPSDVQHVSDQVGLAYNALGDIVTIEPDPTRNIQPLPTQTQVISMLPHAASIRMDPTAPDSGFTGGIPTPPPPAELGFTSSGPTGTPGAVVGFTQSGGQPPEVTQPTTLKAVSSGDSTLRVDQNGVLYWSLGTAAGVNSTIVRRNPDGTSVLVGTGASGSIPQPVLFSIPGPFIFQWWQGDQIASALTVTGVMLKAL